MWTKRNITDIVFRIILVIATNLFGSRFALAGSQSFGNITLTEISPKILTPNLDARNDKVFFRFDNVLTGVPLDTAVYDITGANVATLNLDLGDLALSWDGKDSGGQTCPSGIYIYTIKIGNKAATGTIVLAK